ncbi:MAG: PhoH family protein [Oscillospiraceae bacterium]|jgi:phosphate starvation-inducible PhoH-like protein|nr:PhoH family protein [Oscillospiraceae bacterium]
MYEQVVNIERAEDIAGLFGAYDRNIRCLEQNLGVCVHTRESELRITGAREAVDKAAKVVGGLLALISGGEAIEVQNINCMIDMVEDGSEDEAWQLARDVVCVTAKGRPVKAKTPGQKKYAECIQRSTVTMGIGPAGTGKTYLAVAAAVTAFRRKEVSRVVLTRPAVEAGEKLGFLPGDLHNKVDPYLRPLQDAMHDMLGGESYARHHERGSIEVAPLAYMRGRTLDDSFIILDEAQNTTREQMKMFLTRIGFNSKVVITGDITQIDLPPGRVCGLKEAARILKNIDGIAICELSSRDVVRHELVQKIIRAYETHENKRVARADKA